jgi:diguanylate cyclase (GGDEF)-like protein
MQLIGHILHGGTLIAVNTLMSLLSSLAFFLVYWRRPQLVPPRSLLCWCAAFLAFAAGFAVLMQPAFGLWTPWLGLCGNLLIDLGSALNFVAVVLYLKRPSRDLWVLLPAALIALAEATYVLSHFEDMRVMVVLGGTARGILTVAAAVVLWSCKDESRRSVARLAAAIHAVWALMLLSRMLWWMFNPVAERTFDPTTPFGLTARLVLTCAITPCFLWMLTRQLDAELLHHATRDALTGLLNRRVVWEQGRARTVQAARQNRPLAVLMIDIDHFKRVNDDWGHGAGDAVLAAVGRTLAEAIGADAIAGRVGGEEFLVVPACAADAAALAERLRMAVEALRVPVDGGAILCCTISIGHARGEGPGLDWQRLVTDADRALYAAKRAGRNRVVSLDRVAAGGAPMVA